MDAPQARVFKIFCIIHGFNSPFPVDIKETGLVSELCEAILRRNPYKLKGIVASELKLYQVDVSVPTTISEEDVKKILTEKTYTLDLEASLHPRLKLSKLYPSVPPECAVHIIAQPPPSRYLLNCCLGVADYLTFSPTLRHTHFML